MVLLALVAAGGNGDADFVVGVLVGVSIGFLIGPAIRSWQSYREWAEASREAGLADRLLARMEIDADLDDEPRREAGDSVLGSTWRTHP